MASSRGGRSADGYVGNASHGAALPHNYWRSEKGRQRRHLQLDPAGVQIGDGSSPWPASRSLERRQYGSLDLQERGKGAVRLGAAGSDPWEAAYLRFETPEQEIQKFERRLRQIGAERWSKDARILELCSGRGNGLVALERLGFTHVTGVDLSPRLVLLSSGTCFVGDCRTLAVREASHDVAIVQGDCNHLPSLPEDLEARSPRYTAS